MKLLLSLSLFLFASLAIAQKIEKNNYNEYHLKISADNSFIATDYSKKDDLLLLANKIITDASYTTYKDGSSSDSFRSDLEKFIRRKDGKRDKRNWAIVFAHHNLKEKSGALTYDLQKPQVSILHKERKKNTVNENVWSDYLYKTHNVMFIFIQRTGFDSDSKPIDNKIALDKEKSFFKTSLEDAFDLTKSLLQSQGQDDTKGQIGNGSPVLLKVVVLKKSAVSNPMKISYSVPYIKRDTIEKSTQPVTYEFEFSAVDDLKEPFKTQAQTVMQNSPIKGIVNYESTIKNTTFKNNAKKKALDFKIPDRNYFALTVGLSASQVDLKNLSVDSVRNIGISKLDSANQKEWKDNLMLNLEFYPFGRDIGKLQPLLKDPWTKLYQRIGVYGGVRLNRDFLEALSAGLAFSYSKTVTLTFGYTWLADQIEEGQMVAVPEELSTVEEAKNFFRRSYERSNFTVGISFAPGQIAKALGVGDKDEKSD